MKRIAVFLLLIAFSAAVSAPVLAQKENTRIGENGREAKRAAKQQRKYSKKAAKNQRKALKKNQKAQRKAAKQRRNR